MRFLNNDCVSLHDADLLSDERRNATLSQACWHGGPMLACERSHMMGEVGQRVLEAD